MACEIYNGLTDFRLLDVTKEPECRYEKTCGQTCEDCLFGDIFLAVDEASRETAVTEDDIKQSRVLAFLEAKAQLSQSKLI